MNSENNKGYILETINKYAKKQLISWETIQTAVMLLLIAFFAVVLRAHGRFSVYIIILLVVFIGVAAFGIYETVPSAVMYFKPFSSCVFPKGLTREEKQEICRYVDAQITAEKSRTFLDMTATDRYAVIEGIRAVEVLSWDDIVRVYKKEYPFRKKYKGVYFLIFEDRRGKKHVLDIHNGKQYNPLKQADQIMQYIENNHKNISVEMSATDRERIENRDKLINTEDELKKEDEKNLRTIKEKLHIKDH